MREVIAY